MRLFREILLFSVFALGVSAQNSTDGSATSSAPAQASGRTECSPNWDPSCSFLCGEPSDTKVCSQEFYYDADTGGGCSICRSTASECPTTPSADCAYTCDDTLSGTSHVFCANKDYSMEGVVCTACPESGSSSGESPSNVSSTKSSGSGGSTQTPTEGSGAAGNTGSPENPDSGSTLTTITTSGAASDISSASSTLPTADYGPGAIVCPLQFDPTNCPFFCGDGNEGNTGCSTSWSFTATGNCLPCPQTPSECPESPRAYCAFMCQSEGAAGTVKFCAASDFTTQGLLTCKACLRSLGSGSGGSSSVTPPESNSSSDSTSESTGSPESRSTTSASGASEPTGSPVLYTPTGSQTTGNGSLPTPTYTSGGVSVIGMGSAAGLGLLCIVMFAL
ncbi:hypothetical protein H072_256 [Dactylellina haptotyla CBS 200.50]|uniref:TNFR-Cys domain-containing protein n=1 Tax=Dactylellina haptotyla (strain CBS 200.50) TaxID=1284197 RepID=S8AXS6_DACHA|nr:hypothetical protein H072_256 [Dactylellina haptotyla CBS 200.50]